jgi:hypothetical protein
MENLQEQQWEIFAPISYIRAGNVSLSLQTTPLTILYPIILK